jgi:hypothetical protein
MTLPREDRRFVLPDGLTHEIGQMLAEARDAAPTRLSQRLFAAGFPIAGQLCRRMRLRAEEEAAALRAWDVFEGTNRECFLDPFNYDRVFTPPKRLGAPSRRFW